MLLPLRLNTGGFSEEHSEEIYTPAVMFQFGPGGY